jgi:hypothetical protein
MKPERIVGVVASALCWTGATLAQGSESPTPAPLIEPASVWSGWTLAGVVSHARYREPGLMQLQGPRLGVSVARELTTTGSWQLGLEGQLHSSAMQYSSPISGELSHVPDLETDLRLTARYPLNGASTAGASTAWQWHALAGLAHRWHYNDLRGTTSVGHIGYRRLNQRVYLPLGLQVTGAGPQALSAALEFTPALVGTHTTYMTDVGGDSNATASQSSRGWGLRVGWAFRPGWRLSAHHREWRTQTTDSWASTINGVTKRYIEPASHWQDTGLQLSRRF